MLKEKPNGSMRAGFSLNIDKSHAGSSSPWIGGCYAELFEYDRSEDRLLLLVETSELME